MRTRYETGDPAALRRARLLSRLFDSAVRVPRTNQRVGVDVLVDLVPGGSVLSGILSLYVVAEAVRWGVPLTTLVHMLVNVGIDVVLGSLPFVGLFFDAVWRANERNVALLEGHLETVEGREFTPVEIE